MEMITMNQEEVVAVVEAVLEEVVDLEVAVVEVVSEVVEVVSEEKIVALMVAAVVNFNMNQLQLIEIMKIVSL